MEQTTENEVKQVVEFKEVKDNINRLDKYINQTLSYKQLTDILEIKYYKGDSKQRQLNEIQQYYELEKIKTKYHIISKHDTPIPLVDNRQSIYYDDLEIIILYALKNSNQSYNVWSVSQALFVTTLVNNNYRLGKKDLQLTADAMEEVITE